MMKFASEFNLAMCEIMLSKGEECADGFNPSPHQPQMASILMSRQQFWLYCVWWLSQKGSVDPSQQPYIADLPSPEWATAKKKKKGRIIWINGTLRTLPECCRICLRT